MPAIILLIVYSCLAGMVEAVLYSKRASEAFKWNEHVLFVLKMACIGLLFLLNVSGSYYDRGVDVAVWCLVHPFFHDGAYYETRRRIDVPSYRWYFDYSKTSTARLEIRFVLRVCMLAGAIGLFGVNYLIIR